jgi:hypothetical protein
MADLSITAANVKPGDGAVLQSGIAGVAITHGQAVTVDSATGKVVLAGAASTAAVANMKGIAVSESVGDGQPITYQTHGWVEGMATTEGLVYLLSGTAGGLSPHTDVTTPASTEYACVGGVGGSNSELILGILATSQQVA